MRTSYDLLVIGDTPAAALLIVAFVARRPDATVLHLRLRDVPPETGWTRAFDPNHLPPEVATALDAWQHPHQRVVFPQLDRVFARPLAALPPERLRVAWQRALATHAESRAWDVVDVVVGERVHVPDGTTFSAPWVVDARSPAGARAGTMFMQLQSLSVACRTAPQAVLMAHDATSADVFAFLRVLPTGPETAAVTRVVLGVDAPLPAWDDHRMLAAAARWFDGVPRIIGREAGIVPLPLGTPGIGAGPPLRISAADGWLHPGTGDDTVVLAHLGAALAAADPHAATHVVRHLVQQHAQRCAFPCLMNELVFRATPPSSRWMVFQHFMGLEADLVGRYLGLADTPADRTRIVFRRPPPGVQKLKAAAILARYGLRG